MLLRCTVAASAFLLGLTARAADPKIDYNRDVRPILSDACYACHGPDKNKRKAGLRLDTKEGALAALEEEGGGGAGAKRFAIVPGDVKKSVLIERIFSSDDDERMPPRKSIKKLTDAQKNTLRQWIEQGAEWKAHWAYIPPEKTAAPAVKNAKWCRNDVDRHILARLEQSGLAPAEEASKTTLMRRLSFDLTGLPPSSAEVDAFLADASPDAYEKQVDRLLASPHFGERMALYWLDLVRFADTAGYHSDNPRNIAPYRDYVIQAFNENKPFDKFTVEQLAGDLLPSPTLHQKVATGYNRLLQTTEEGGAQAKEYRAKYAADRVRNASSVWMGATLGCAECHDHKFDPYSTKDFYSFAAFFADVKEADLGRREPGMAMPTGEQAREIKQFDEKIAELKKKLEGATPELSAAQAEWEKTSAVALVEWTTLRPKTLVAKSGAKLALLDDGAILASGTKPDKETYTLTVPSTLKEITAIRLEVLPDKALPKSGPGRSDNGNFVLTEFEMSVETVKAGDAGPKVGPASVPAKSGPAPAPAGRDAGPTKVKWSGATATHSQKDFDVKNAIDGKPASGWAILKEVGKANHAVFETTENIGPAKQLESISLSFTLHFDYGTAHSLGRFRLAATNAKRPVKAGGSLPPEVQAILALAAEKRSAEQKNKLAAHYRSIAPLLEPLRKELAGVEKQKTDLEAKVPKTLVSTADTPRVVRILPRGNWLDDSGEIVTPAVPRFMKQISFTQGKVGPASLPAGGEAKAGTEAGPTTRATRLDLANWLVARDNPLTARVFVNRLWKLYFGQGLSRSLDDLGLQGESPSHPELLDMLAVEFMDHGWDVKHMLKLLVTSAAYRQSSRASKELKEKDPYNRLYACQSRFRLDAEMVRDNALAVSGLLSRKIGGESVRPYQPVGYWQYLNFPTREWKTEPGIPPSVFQGENLYRRGLYTWWQRSFLHPSLLAFDAPSREECTAERPRSNTPQQALVLLNDPQYVEAARVLAERIIKEGGGDTAARLAWAFRQVLSRQPAPEEARVLTELFKKHLENYTADKAEAEKLVSVGEAPRAKDLNVSEHAAWMSVARAIMNLHETVTRE